MAVLRIAGMIVMSAFVLRAEDFRLNHFGAGPVTLRTTLTYDGKGERLIATAKNESGVPIEHAKLCIVSATVNDGCLFELWNTLPWAPGAELSWNVTTKRKVPDLSHEVTLVEFLAVKVREMPGTAGPTPAPVAAAVGTSPNSPINPAVTPVQSTAPRPAPNTRSAKIVNLETGTVLDSQSAKTFVYTGSSTQTSGGSATFANVTGNRYGAAGMATTTSRESFRKHSC